MSRIVVASLIWGGSVLLSRLVGLARDAVLGRTLGVSADADLYWAAFVLPDFLNYLLAGGALTIVFLPLYQAHLARGDERGAARSLASVGAVLGAALLCLTAAAWWLAPQLVPLVAPGFDAAQRAELAALTRIVLPAQVFHVLGGLLSASLQARDRHGLPALAPVVYTGAVVAGGLIGGTSAGAEGFAWGVLAGSALGPFGLPLAGCLRAGVLAGARPALRHPDLGAYLARSLPIMLALSIVAVDDWILRREASRLGEGAVGAIAYAKNLMRVPLGVVGLALGVAAYPTLARLAAAEGPRAMGATLARALRYVIVLACAAQAVLTAGARDLVALLYGTGRIAPEEVETVATALVLVSLGLAAWSAQNLIARGFYALGNTWVPAALGTGVAALAYPLYVALGERFGVAGLAAASSAAIGVYAALLGGLLARRAPIAVAGARWGDFLLRALVATALAAGVGRAAVELLPAAQSTAGLALRAAVATAAALLTFGGVAGVLGLGEVRALAAPLGRLAARGRPAGPRETT